MLWFIISHLFTALLNWVSIGRRSNQEKDLVILILHQQVRMLELLLDKPVHPSSIEKLILAVVTREGQIGSGPTSVLPIHDFLGYRRLIVIGYPRS